MSKTTGITFTPRKGEFSSRTWYPEDHTVSRNDFRGTMSLESLSAIFPDTNCRLEMKFGDDEVHVSPLNISSVAVDGKSLRSSDVFIAHVGVENIFRLGTEEFDVSAFHC